jgi:hypothetical protein
MEAELEGMYVRYVVVLSRIKTDSQFIFKIRLNISFFTCFPQDGDEDIEGPREIFTLFL